MSVEQVSFTNLLSKEDDSEEDSRNESVEENIDSPELAIENAVGYVMRKFQEASDDRTVTENIWLKSWRAFRGEYSPEERAKLDEALKRNPTAADIFVKITKTKVMAAVGQLLEVLDSDKRFPITVEATPVPEGVPKHVYLENEQNSLEGSTEDEDPYGFPGDGRELPKGATHKDLLGGLQGRLKEFIGNKKLVEGPAPDKTQLIQLNPADRSAEEMDRTLQDQLIESDAKFSLRRVALDCAIFGTGVIKAPFTQEKVIHDWKLGEDGKMSYNPRYKLSPDIKYVSNWNFYPDPDADDITNAEYAIERHLMARSQLRSLANQTKMGFRRDAILECLEGNSQYDRESWEDQLQDNTRDVNKNRYQVYEYWGILDARLARYIGLSVNDDIVDNVQVNLWVCNGHLIRAILNPLVPSRLPYYPVPYEEHPKQIWGIGVPENIDDTQDLMNGHIRMALDNLKLSGNVIYEINQDMIVPGQDLKMYPGKTIFTQGPLGQAINTLNFNNTAPAHIQMYDKIRQLADEKTGIPSYSHGQTGVSGMTRTASGMSMLMGASALNVKTVIKNFDHHLLKPLGEALFAWNMQFNKDVPEIRGDLNVKASGTSSLMQREVVTQRILSLIQVAANPLFAPYLNVENAFREIAKNLDLDPDTFINDPKMAALYSESIMSNINGIGNTQGPIQQANPAAGTQGGEGASQSTGGINPQDTTGSGGGNIGIGSAPGAGEAGFAGGTG